MPLIFHKTQSTRIIISKKKELLVQTYFSRLGISTATSSVSVCGAVSPLTMLTNATTEAKLGFRGAHYTGRGFHSDRHWPIQ